MDIQLLTLEEVQDKLHLSQTTVKALISTGAITSLKIGRSRRVPAEAVRQYVHQLLETQRPELAKAA